jgi:tetratricopeptide (TPR) repeat protein
VITSTNHDMIMRDRRKNIGLVLIVVLGMTAAICLVQWIDQRRPVANPADDESLYLNAKTVRRMSLAFNGLAADWYWMRSLQYVGKKIINLPEDVELDSLQQLDLKILAPLLDTATTLDPEFFDPYEYAAVVLPAVDVDQAIRITQKGIDANPNTWRLYQHLGYIYWQQKNYQAAGETYGRGAKVPGAPVWMEAMKAKMAAEGGSRATAREIYTRMYEQSGDPKVQDMARKRLMQLTSFDELEVLQKILAAYQTRTGRCPTSWKEVEAPFRSIRLPLDANGAPFDPSGTPYLLKADKCEATLNPKSEVPLR